MSEILSQNEIDELLKAMSSGSFSEDDADSDSTEVKVRGYDFRTANRFSKEHIKTLNMIYENFAMLFTTYLSGTLRAMCQVDVVSIEEQKYQEFTNALPTPVVLGIFSMPPLVGPTLIEISPNVTYMIISRLLGGIESRGSSAKSFTEIELALVERVLRQFILLLKESWERVIKIETHLDRIETSPQFAQIVAANETIAIITLNVKIGASEGLVNFCIPHLALEPVSKLLNTRNIFRSSLEDSSRAPATAEIQQRINVTRLDVKAQFNDTKNSFRDILHLQPGDVIRLDHKLNDPLTVKVGHLPKFMAEIGVKDRRYAMKITDILREEDLEHEQ